MCSERKHGLSAEQFPVSAYVRSSKNLKDLQATQNLRERNHGGRVGNGDLQGVPRMQERGVLEALQGSDLVKAIQVLSL